MGIAEARQELLDMFVEEHGAVEQLLYETTQSDGVNEPTKACLERLVKAFATVAKILKAYQDWEDARE